MVLATMLVQVLKASVGKRFVMTKGVPRDFEAQNHKEYSFFENWWKGQFSVKPTNWYWLRGLSSLIYTTWLEKWILITKE